MTATCAGMLSTINWKLSSRVRRASSARSDVRLIPRYRSIP